MPLKLKVIPTMRCDTGCGDCCGPVPATEVEYQKVVALARSKNVIPVKQGMTCPFYQDGTCQVYEARPIMCRVFGHVPKLACSRGYNTNMSEKKVYALIDQGGPAVHLLHETLVEFGVVGSIEEALDFK